MINFCLILQTHGSFPWCLKFLVIYFCLDYLLDNFLLIYNDVVLCFCTEPQYGRSEDDNQCENVRKSALERNAC